VIDIDDAAVAQVVFEHFRQCRVRNVAYVGNTLPLEAVHSARRGAVFARLAKSEGMTCRSCEFACGREWTSELNRLAAWLTTLPTPCGIFAYSDEIAKVVMDASRLAHLRIPDLALLVGVDNDPTLCENLQPSLTSVEPDFETAGFVAAGLLDRILTDRRPQRTIKQTYGVRDIVERASTQDVSGSRRIVAAALELIRLEAPTPDGLDVTRLCRKLNVSRSLLNRLFRTVLDCGVAERIRQVRLHALAERLIASDASITDICHNTGFGSQTHVKTLFRRQYGQTMRDYRKSGA